MKLKWIFPLLLTTVFLVFEIQSCQQPYQQGKALYTANCERCHGKNGEGFEDLYPTIQNSPYLAQPGNLSCLIVYGSEYLNRVRSSDAATIMPDNKHLTQVEILNIVNYVSYQLGNRKEIRLSEVSEALENCGSE